MINGYVLQFIVPLNQLGFIAGNIRKGLNDLAGVMEIYKTPTTLHTTEKTLHPLEQLESIEFKNVSFEYEPSHLVLKDLSFHLQAGKTIGIVGATAGKNKRFGI